MSMYIDESTFLQLIEAVKTHREDMLAFQERTGVPLNYREMHTINSGIDLERAARSQARAAGIVAFGSIKGKPE